MNFFCFICLTKMQTPDFLSFIYYKYMENENEDGKKKPSIHGPLSSHCVRFIHPSFLIFLIN
jgi:hypothetical protein